MYEIIGVSILVLAILLFVLLQPKYKKFKEVTLYNVLWKWRWNGKNIYALSCYCPTCQSELYFDDENAKISKNLNEKITFFICKKCNEEEKGRIQGGDRNYAKSIVTREIHRLVNNKKFEEILDEQKRIQQSS